MELIKEKKKNYLHWLTFKRNTADDTCCQAFCQ
jgi:hypothetical protein